MAPDRIESLSEEWRPISRYEGIYEVSSLGRVRRINGNSRRSGRLLKLIIHHKGYIIVSLYKNGRMKSAFVHSLVAEAFIGPRPLLAQVNHKDGIKNNSQRDNLEYVTPEENRKHAAALGLYRGPCGEEHGNAKLKRADILEIRHLAVRMISLREIADIYGLKYTTVWDIVNRKRWKHVV